MILGLAARGGTRRQQRREMLPLMAGIYVQYSLAHRL
jgi:hypothetical protein